LFCQLHFLWFHHSIYTLLKLQWLSSSLCSFL
jgi:hypothetical protein